MTASGTRIISIASGKGGVGKTSVAVNLAWALGSIGRKVCLLDADLGLSNVDILLGLSPKWTLEDVIFAGLPMEKALMDVGSNVSVISGSSGVSRMAELSRQRRSNIIREFEKLQGFDYLLVDNSPGITAQIVSICLSSKEIILVANPDRASIADVYALIKVLRENGLWWNPLFLVNRAANDRQARLIFEKINQTSQRYLKQNCRYMGHIPEDRALKQAAGFRTSVVELNPSAPSSRAFLDIAWNMDAFFANRSGQDVSPDKFWDQSVIRIQQGPRLQDGSSSAPGEPAARAADDLDLKTLGKVLVKVEDMVRHLARTPEPGRRQRGADRILMAINRVIRRLDEASPGVAVEARNARNSAQSEQSGQNPEIAKAPRAQEGPKTGEATTKALKTEAEPPTDARARRPEKERRNTSSQRGRAAMQEQAGTSSTPRPDGEAAGRPQPRRTGGQALKTGDLSSGGSMASKGRGIQQAPAGSAAADSIGKAVGEVGKSASRDTAEPEPVRPRPGVLPGRTVHILCQDRSMMEVLSELVEELGLHPVAVSPLRRKDMPDLSRARFCIICCDITMGELETLLDRAGSTPVILVEGFSGRVVLHPSYRDKVAAIVEKPFRIDRLFDVLRPFA